MQRTVFATVIIPTFNQAAYLPAALDSLLAQSDVDWEAIVVNDGSTDNTAEIAESYVRKDSRIRCIHKSNGGVASALNTGLESARGDWIHWLSSDDMFEPEKLAINRRWIERHPDTKFFFSYFTLLTEATGVREKRGLWGPLPAPAHQLLTLFYRNYVSGISICVSRATWEEVGFLNESLRYGQDYEQWLRLLQRCKGLFIPEWTVINRNHAGQNSEVFPEACYFDTAKAAINFINVHSFKELVPWLDFSNKEAVREAVSYTLDVVSDRTAFLYSLGVHPALILRVLEWVFSTECDDFDLRCLVRQRVADNSFAEGDDDWSWMWRQLSTAIHPDRVLCSYYPVCHLHLGLHEYRQRRLCGKSSAESLRDYLVEFESIIPNDLPVVAKNGPRIVFLLGSKHTIDAYIPIVQQLSEMGVRILVIMLISKASSIVWQQYPWGILIGVAAYDKDCLPWLGEVELVVALPGITIPLWLSGVAGIQLELGETAQRVIEYVNDSYFSQNAQKRPVVFLERVLWGGGAERVVMDLVRYLDRQRYSPIILTMFNEHTDAPKLPSHVMTYNKFNLTNVVANGDNIVASSGNTTSLPFGSFESNSAWRSLKIISRFCHSRLWFRLVVLRYRVTAVLYSIYCRVLPGKLRAKLRLGRRVFRLRQIILAKVGRRG